MTRDEIESVVRKFYADRTTNDLDRTFETWADNASLDYAGCSSASPFPCHIEGLPAVREACAQVLKTWPWKKVDIQSLIIDGNKAAVHYRLTTGFSPTGEELETDVVDLITLKNGKIVGYVEFVDTAKVVQLANAAAA